MNRTDTSTELAEKYEKLIFAEIFSHYAANKKGDLALGLLVDQSLINGDGTSKLIVSKYIREGLEWLLK